MHSVGYYWNKYGYTSKGIRVPTPSGWKLIPEGAEIPQEHREYIEDYSRDRSHLCEPRRCHSTMTPIKACVWGGVRAIFEKK